MSGKILILMRCISTVNEILLKGNSIFVNMHEEWKYVYDWGSEKVAIIAKQF